MMLPTLLAAMIDRGIGEGSRGFIIKAAIIMGASRYSVSMRKKLDRMSVMRITL